MRVRILLAASLLALACDNPAEPTTEFLAQLRAISVPPVADAALDVVATFEYDDSCGARHIAITYRPDTATVAVTGTLPRDAVCPALVRFTPFQILIPAQVRGESYAVRFRRGEAADTVATIQRAPAP